MTMDETTPKCQQQSLDNIIFLLRSHANLG